MRAWHVLTAAMCMTNIVLYKQAEGVCLHNLSLSHKYYVMKLAFVSILPRTQEHSHNSSRVILTIERTLPAFCQQL